MNERPPIFRSLLPLLALACAAFARESADSAVVRDLREQVTALRAEVAALRLEVRQCRDSSPALRRDSARDSSRPAIADGRESGHRCSKSGNKRHNPSCRYFNAAERPCGPGDGVPCKLCGG